MLLVAALMLAPAGARAAAAEQGTSSDTQVIQAFSEAMRESAQRAEITEQRKHAILFLMGVVLLVCMLGTAGLGVAMAIFGKKVFVAHTIFAGLSVTLALAHAVVAVVWFWPF
jgi:hypothetical protein